MTTEDIVEIVQWLFDGLGTLLVGLALGAGGGAAVTRGVIIKRHQQRQQAGDNSSQMQVGGDNVAGDKR